ncbi:MAG: hypothetical protein QOE30_4739 [Mycobacterium sp.]|jgi:CTP-dependent riboflavin kinase|uniref:hypothetical protein n=1 Tax=Mycobacterium sp. TaxID=1785 RepID=UPI0028B579A8|nr:hypothetical protein [Mycobacterium sp.]MDT5119000.1 hypothetical protein [Mycobacterium sp.]
MKGNVEKLAAARAAGLTLADSARAAGMSTRTAQRRLDESEVIDLIQANRTKQAEVEQGAWTQLRGKGMSRLERLIDSEDERVALRAIDMVLHGGERFAMVHEFVSELGAVRKQVLAVEAALPDEWRS